MAITISGANNVDKILATDGVLDSISGFNVVGVMTAGTFDVTGKTTTGHLNVGSNIHIGNAGIITATTLIGNVTGNINHTSNLLLQISGSEKFRVGTSGQLGIGGANYGSAGQVLTSGGSGSAATWSTIASDKITEGNTEAEVVDTGSDGYFKVTTEGSERLRVDASGDVLIGTTDDAIYGDSSGEGIVLRGGECIDINRSGDSMLNLNRLSSDGPYINFRRDGSVKTALSTRSNAFCIDVAGSEKLRVDTSGDVLIGTTDDSVYNNSSGTGVVIRSGDCIDIARNDDNQLFLNRQSGDGYHIAFLRDGSYKSFISTRSNAFCIDVAGSERLRIFSNGSVGVGDYSSTNLTHAFQALRTSGSTYVSSKNTGGDALFYAEASNGNTAKLELMQAGVGNFTLEVGSDNALMFKDDGTERLRITSGGKFGFGTNSPYTYGIATFNDSNGIVLEGSSQGRLLFRHTGGGTNLKMFDIQSSNGVMKFRTIADNGTTVTERLTITAAGTVTASGTFESTGTGAGVGGKFGQISVGAGGVYNTIQNTVANTPIHLQYSNTGNIKCNEGGGDMQTRDIFPESNNSYSLGTDANRWANIHTNDLNLSNEGSTNDVDGTWGQYTIQEGEHDLFLINKRNGKRYKFNLTEVD